MIRILAVYFPNEWNYDLNGFHKLFNDIERLPMEVMDKWYALIIAGELNLYLERGDQWRIIVEFCEQFSMDIANI